MGSDAFDVIPFEDIKGDWKKLGSGSFGNVYKASYLGIDVAIKEVLPSNEYDVAKYFEREWRLMKEARHPNVVLYLGLSRAPEPDNRIFIISEYIENGNLRMYIHDKTKPLPWRLRLSFATDIARALAYLHARKCIHRDLKGENLLCTENGRLKITDFGFARIAARNDDESKRLTFCGTDSYMSPEILIGDPFDLPTDIFSLGVIFCELAARKLADDHTFKRTAPGFGIDAQEVHQLASPGCPPAFISLALDCLSEDPAARPTTRAVLERLREIEAEILLRPSDGQDLHVGSVKLMSAARRPGAAPRIPSFGQGAGKDAPHTHAEDSDSDTSDDELMEAVANLESARVGNGSAWGQSQQPLLDDMSSTASTVSTYSEYSTTVIRSPPASLSSVLTVRPNGSPTQEITPSAESLMSIASYHTAHSSIAPSIAMATEGGSTIRSLPLVHRFTLIKPGAKRAAAPAAATPPGRSTSPARAGEGSWNPLDLFFSSGLLVAKCDICTKRLGWKPVLECDDCGLRTHVKCGELAPRDCGLRPPRPGPGSAPSTPLKAKAQFASPR
ncbi:hypothetical protein PLICRDRAFT_47044 [Plicaturopsis crispa FD-325 SS-3]|uniref:TKL/LISK/LISK-DD1 protein kinase n=1 Tax=Plicaturopsis crispa FD-325 SS-3 TaxID=944288 RepID=A0A0C9SKJ6_PLICR|nr:hypothetical protein PLICRDRAFT_47044 [Plicaturopsis crispa FD-325 SS-3]